MELLRIVEKINDGGITLRLLKESLLIDGWARPEYAKGQLAITEKL
jgi:hypothetical protein